MLPHRIRLALKQRPDPAWLDARSTLVSGRKPVIIQGCAARLEFAIIAPELTAGAETLESPSGLSLITLEFYARRAPGTDTAALAVIAPDVFSGSLNTSLTKNDWDGGATANCHFSFDLTGDETNPAGVLDNDAPSAELWLEVYGTLSGQRKLLGSGPVILERSAAGGTPGESAGTYYTQAQVDALFSARPEVSVTSGVASFTLGGTTYSFPVGSAS